MPSIKAMRLINALEAGQMSASGLETYLQNSANLGEFQSLLALRGISRRIATSLNAVTAILNSNTAVSVAADNYNASRELVSNPVAVAAVINNGTAWSTFCNKKIAAEAIAKSGLFLDSLVVNAARMATVASSAVAMAAVAQSKNAIGKLLENATSMSAVTGSIVAVSAISKKLIATKMLVENQQAFNSLITNSDNVEEFLKTSYGRDMLLGNTTSRSSLFDSITGMDGAVRNQEFLKSIFVSTTHLSVLSNKPVFWEAISGNADACENMLTNVTAQNVSTYISSNSVSSQKLTATTTAMNAIVSSDKRSSYLTTGAFATALASSSIGIDIVVQNQSAMIAIFGTATSMDAVFNNDISAGKIAGSSIALAEFYTKSNTSGSVITQAFTSYPKMRTALVSNSTALTSMMSTDTAVAAIKESRPMLLEFWKSETALTAMRNSTLFTSFASGSNYLSIGGNANPSGLTAAMYSGKCILLTARSNNGNGSDTCYMMDTYENEVNKGSKSYSTTWNGGDTKVVNAYENIRFHYSTNNTVWSGIILKVS